MSGVFSELRRRNVFRVGAAYAVVAWLLVQASDIMLSNFGAPDWVFKTIVAVLIIGFPLALFLAWAYELTPEGVKRSRQVAGEAAIAHPAGRRMDWVIVGGLALVIAITVLDRFWPGERQGASEPRVSIAETAPAATSIAVLAFEDLSPQRDQEYFAEGMSEEILNLLARVPGLRVAGRTSSFQFKGRQADLREIGELLGVQTILEGSVRKSDERLRITAQLISAADGFHLWSETYDRELTDAFAIQDDISDRIVQALRNHLVDGGEIGSVNGSEAVARDERTDPETHTLYLRGMHHWHRRRVEDFYLAIDYFEQAIAREPRYAAAHAGLSLTEITLTGYDPATVSEMLPRARASAQRALSLDAGSADAHAALALVHSREWDWDGGERHLRRALELNPNHVTALHWLSQHLVGRGQLDEALELARRALELDPISVIINNNLGFVHLFREENEEAARAFEATLELDPAFPTVMGNLWQARLRLGQIDQALAMLDRMEAVGTPVDHLRAFTEWRRDPELRNAALSRISEFGREVEYQSYYIADLLAQLGAHDEALDWLERANQQRHFNMPYLVVHPPFRPLWGNPRFERLVQDLDLEQARFNLGLAP